MEVQLNLYYVGPTLETTVPICKKIAMFDLDDTIITTASGRKFPMDRNDWKFRFDSVPQKLTDLQAQGFVIHIITNQAGISKHPDTLDDIVSKIKDVLTKLNGADNIKVWIAAAKDVWRKPNTAIVEHYILPTKAHVQGVKKIFYVGDAAGRPGDFSDSDRKFAYNIYLWMRYLYPELDKSQHPGFESEKAFFEGAVEKYKFEGIDPTKFIKATINSNQLNNIISHIKNVKEPFMLCMIGPPASGKSTLSKRIVESLELVNPLIIVNQDELKTQAACLKRLKAAVSNGSNIILDKTNPSAKSRQPFLDALSEDYNVVYVYLNVPRLLAQHLSIVRLRSQPGSKHIPDVAYAQYYKSLELPESYITIDFQADFNGPDFLKNKMYFLQRS